MNERPVVWPMRIFYPFLAIFPLLLAAYFTATYVFGYWRARPYLPVLIAGWGALACLCIYAFRRVSGTVSRGQEWLLLGVLALLAFTVRMYAVLLIQTQPAVDFWLAHQNAVSLAQTGVPSDPHVYSMATAWGFYAITLSGLYSLFEPSVFTTQAFNCVLDTATVVLLYFGTKLCLKSRIIAFFAASFYAFFPSIIIYIGVLTPEFIAIPLMTGSILLLEYLQRSRRSGSKWFWVWAVSIGLVWGVANAYRPFGVVFLVAFAGAEFLFFILPAIRDRIREKKLISTNTPPPVPYPSSKSDHHVLRICYVSIGIPWRHRARGAENGDRNLPVRNWLCALPWPRAG
ncbi:phospholipid carrier-dependent glycosyltransferase [Anaerotruncus sp.]|uniref:phospholipid carrier-dependent glycosyltransferase n=1 Tax=Anaerotruncus sp. TaxID=1872531 RepID=UPI00216D0A6D|nr:phospholipid carrier-dependent glycosyltransferase [Anaerotruncus sp.]MCI8494059.1 phospholipid carrier-dependent glycosyltransferase [Anaerotruncus sp.]